MTTGRKWLTRLPSSTEVDGRPLLFCSVEGPVRYSTPASAAKSTPNDPAGPHCEPAMIRSSTAPSFPSLPSTIHFRKKMGEKKKPPSRVSFVQLQISRPDRFQPARSRLTHDYFTHHGLCYHTQMGCFSLRAAGSREIFLRRGSKCRDGHSGEGAYKFFFRSSHLSKGEVA